MRLAGVLVVVLVACILVACDGDDFNDVFDNDVETDVSCEKVECNADVEEFFVEGNREFRICTWECADYRGGNDDFVELTFVRRVDGCWMLDNEFIIDGNFC
jgi:hypothetical protein